MIMPDEYVLNIDSRKDEVIEMAKINRILLDENKRLRSELFKIEAEVVKLTNILDNLFEEVE